MDYKAMGQRIRIRRVALHMTQEELATRTGISAPFLGHIERGSRVASLETFVQLCRVLRITPNEALGADVAGVFDDLPERVEVSVPSLLQSIAYLLKSQQLPD